MSGQFQNELNEKKGLVILRRMTLEDVPFTVSLRNDHDTRKWFFSPQKVDIESSKKWFLSRNSKTAWDFIAELNGERVGYLAIYNIDWTHKKAEWGSWMIVPKYRGTLVARQMGKQMLEIAKKSGLNLLYSEGSLHNVRSLKACKKLGFKVETFPEKNRFRVTINPQEY